MDLAAILSEAQHAPSPLYSERYLDKMATDLSRAARRANLHWAAILCSCDPRYSPGQPAWANCLVHGEFLILPDGRIL